MGKPLTILGASFSGGQGRQGVDDAPPLIEKAGLADECKKLGWSPEWNHLTFSEPKDDTVVNNMKRPRYVSSAAKKIYESVSQTLKDGRFPLTIGGDHSIAIGTVAGVLSAHPDAVVLWIDAHADINTPEATLSGNLHGCPLSFITGIDNQDKTDNDLFSWVPRGKLDWSRLAYIGLRDVDEFEKQLIREKGIAAYSMHDIDRHGIAKVMDMALERVNPGLKRPIHLSFDVDATDPMFCAPSTGTPVRGGLTWREACYVCEAVAETDKLVAMDLVEINPHIGEHDNHVAETVLCGIALVKSALGQLLL